VNSSELAQQLRKGFSAVGGFDGLDSQAMADAFVAALESHVTDDFTSRMVGVGDLTWEGLEGLRAGWRDFLEGFDYLKVTPEELHENPAGECVVDFVRMEGRPRGTGAQIEQPAAAVWRIRDGKIAAVEFYIDRDAALRSAGL